MFMRYVGLGVGHSFRTSLPAAETAAVSEGTSSDTSDEDDPISRFLAVGGDLDGGSEVESNPSDNDNYEELVEVEDGEGDAEADGPELGPEDGEDAAEYDIDDEYVGYEDP